MAKMGLQDINALLPPRDSRVCYLHLDITEQYIECKCYYRGYANEYALSNTHDGAFAFDDETKCSSYFDKIITGILSDKNHCLHATLSGRDEDSLNYAQCVVICYNAKNRPNYGTCDALKHNYLTLLQSFIDKVQKHLCKKNSTIYFHTDFCSRNKDYINPHLLYTLYTQLRGLVCPIPLKIDLSKNDIFNCSHFADITNNEYNLVKSHDPEPYQEPHYKEELEDNKMTDNFNNPTPNDNKDDKGHGGWGNNGGWGNQGGWGNNNGGSWGNQGGNWGGSQGGWGHHGGPSDNDNEGGCNDCAYFAPPPVISPVVTLGKCFKWDTKRCRGVYKIDIPSCTDDGSQTPNTHAVAHYLYCYNGCVAWASECHGTTTVCMDNVCQLIDAMRDPLQLSILVSGKSKEELKAEIARMCNDGRFCDPSKV